MSSGAEGSVACPHCRMDISADARFCLYCGESLSHVCLECGAPQRTDAKFCTRCGSVLPEGARVAEPPVPAPPATVVPDPPATPVSKLPATSVPDPPATPVPKLLEGQAPEPLASAVQHPATAVLEPSATIVTEPRPSSGPVRASRGGWATVLGAVAGAAIAGIVGFSLFHADTSQSVAPASRASPSATVSTQEQAPDPRSIDVQGFLDPGFRLVSTLYGDLDGDGVQEIVVHAVKPVGDGPAKDQVVDVLAWSNDEWTTLFAGDAAPLGASGMDVPDAVLRPATRHSGQWIDLLRLVDVDMDTHSDLVLSVGSFGASEGPTELWVISFADTSPRALFYEASTIGGSVSVRGSSLIFSTDFYAASDPPCCPSAGNMQTIRWDQDGGRLVIAHQSIMSLIAGAYVGPSECPALGLQSEGQVDGGGNWAVDGRDVYLTRNNQPTVRGSIAEVSQVGRSGLYNVTLHFDGREGCPTGTYHLSLGP